MPAPCKYAPEYFFDSANGFVKDEDPWYAEWYRQLKKNNRRNKRKRRHSK